MSDAALTDFKIRRARPSDRPIVATQAETAGDPQGRLSVAFLVVGSTVVWIVGRL